MKAQVFSLDLILGVLIMTAALITAYIFFPDTHDTLTADSKRVSTLMTPGVPENWTVSDVIIPGFLSNDRFNQTKIAAFASLTEQEQRVVLGVQSVFTVRFYQNNTDIGLCATCGTAPVSYKQLLPIRRYGLLGSNVTIMEVFLYR